MTPPAPDPEPLVGRGLRDGAQLVRDWFAGLDATARAGQGAAYVFVMGSLAELVRSFDLPVVFPEIHSLQTAVRRVAGPYLNEAEEIGYSSDICGYVKADVAIQRRGGEHPMGRIPPPAIAVLTTACNTYLKWAEIWERHYHVPVFVLDVPGGRRAPGAAGDLAAEGESDRRYVLGQLRELVALCERTTGRRYDPDRLATALAWSRDALAGWRRALAANRARPAPFGALVEGTVYLGVLNALRGTAAAAAYFDDLAVELEHKAAAGIGALDEERFRLAFAGVPCYPIFRRFHELFAGHGGVFVASTYLEFASGGAGAELAPASDDPLVTLADDVLSGVSTALDSMFFADRALARSADFYGLDGVVFHAVKSCRTTSSGMADARRALLAARDLPSLMLESDMMDARVVAEAQLKNRVDAFFEALEARRRAVVA